MSSIDQLTSSKRIIVSQNNCLSHTPCWRGRSKALLRSITNNSNSENRKIKQFVSSSVVHDKQNQQQTRECAALLSLEIIGS